MKRRALLGAISASMIGMAGCLGQNEYTVSKPTIEQTDGPLRIDATVKERDITIDSPKAKLTLTLENTIEDPIEIRTANLWPFGMPAIVKKENQYWIDILLLSDRYEELDSVNVESNSGGQSVRVSAKRITRTLDPKQAVTREFYLRGGMIHQSGTYKLQGYRSGPSLHTESNETVRDRSRRPKRPLLEYQPPNRNEYRPYLPTVSVTITTKGLLPKL